MSLLMNGIKRIHSEPHSELLNAFRGKNREKRRQKLHYFGQIVSFGSRLYLFPATVPDLVHHVGGLLKQQSFVLS